MQAEDCQARKIRVEKLSQNWQDSNRILHHQNLPYIFKIIKIEQISRHHDNLPAGYLGIERMQKLVTKKSYWEILCNNIEVYVKGFNVCLVFQKIKPKLYGYLQQLPVPTHSWRNLFISFVTGFLNLQIGKKIVMI